MQHATSEFVRETWEFEGVCMMQLCYYTEIPDCSQKHKFCLVQAIFQPVRIEGQQWSSLSPVLCSNSQCRKSLTWTQAIYHSASPRCCLSTALPPDCKTSPWHGMIPSKFHESKIVCVVFLKSPAGRGEVPVKLLDFDYLCSSNALPMDSKEQHNDLICWGNGQYERCSARSISRMPTKKAKIQIWPIRRFEVRAFEMMLTLVTNHEAPVKGPIYSVHAKLPELCPFRSSSFGVLPP